jgi:hypothetical protein
MTLPMFYFVTVSAEVHFDVGQAKLRNVTTVCIRTGYVLTRAQAELFIGGRRSDPAAISNLCLMLKLCYTNHAMNTTAT